MAVVGCTSSSSNSSCFSTSLSCRLSTSDSSSFSQRTQPYPIFASPSSSSSSSSFSSSISSSSLPPSILKLDKHVDDPHSSSPVSASSQNVLQRHPSAPTSPLGLKKEISQSLATMSSSCKHSVDFSHDLVKYACTACSPSQACTNKGEEEEEEEEEQEEEEDLSGSPKEVDPTSFVFPPKQTLPSLDPSFVSPNEDPCTVKRCETSITFKLNSTLPYVGLYEGYKDAINTHIPESLHTSDYHSVSSSSHFPHASRVILSSQPALPSSSLRSSTSSVIHRVAKANPLQSFLMKILSSNLSLQPPLQDNPHRTSAKSFRARPLKWFRGCHVGLTLVFLILHLLAQATPSDAHVAGENMRCHQEGEAVNVPKEVLKDNPCLQCVCENGIVVCNKKRCLSMEGCYWKLFNTLGKCCQECKGCEHEGKMYKHGSSWSDGCNHYECLSGVLTVSQTQCHLPCYATLPKGENQCCQRCHGCWLEGRHIPEGESVASRTDPCIQCVCSSGKLSCEKKSCPVLSCPSSRQVPLAGSCCKTCQGSRDLISPPGGRCFLNGHLYETGSDRIVDPCTVCTCHNGYITCKRHTCPVLNCSKEFQMMLENECCPTCSPLAEQENVCRVPGMVRKDGEQWQVDKCTSCKCTDGETTCHMISCEYGNKPCPPGYRRIESESECCPRCEEAPGVCVVFGDPHYHTFDGMLFNFQGACKYTLAKSCKGRDFNLKVYNDARRSALFSWTKSLSLSIPGAKVKLGQKLRTKVNGRRIKPPYFESDGLNITREGLALLISTPQGIRILWDGASYVEVEVPLEMKGQVCGLCGNFNGNLTDDLTTSDGTIMDTADQMALSWSTGKARECSRKMRDREKEKEESKEKKEVERSQKRMQRQNCPVTRSGLIQCGLLNSTVFQACHAAASIDQFYKSCVLDMCECKSTRRCECDTIQAYARQCERLGIPIPGWRQLSKCGGMECPHGAEYMECAPPCRPSCRNPTPNPDCYTRRCRAGCFCPPPTVLHRGTCIPTQECPRRAKKRNRNR